MTTLLTRISRPRAHICRGEPKRRSWCISQAEFWRLYLTLVVGVVGALAWWGLS